MSLFIRKEKLNNSGFSLVEVLIAIVILAIISLPVLSTFSNAAKINAKARRTENANTAINNIVEEARITSIDNLADGEGKYNKNIYSNSRPNFEMYIHIMQKQINLIQDGIKRGIVTIGTNDLIKSSKKTLIRKK